MEPAEEVQIWAPILADPLGCPPSSATIPLPSQVEEYFSYVYGVDGMEISKVAQEPEDDLGDLIVKETWWRGLRGPRKRRIFPWGSGGINFLRRKNNEHWTHEEVKKLVKGVKTYGVGRWTMVKNHHQFETQHISRTNGGIFEPVGSRAPPQGRRRHKRLCSGPWIQS